MLMLTRRQKIQLELALEPAAKGEARSAGDQGTEACVARAVPERPATGPGPSMEAVVQPGNLKKALARVRRDKGGPGLDGMTVEELGAHLKDHWPEIRSRLLGGTYEPQPVRRAEILKASGGVRPLGVPTALDRFIQQAVMQVLQKDWDPGLSEASYGFRPGRSAHQVVSFRKATKTPATSSWARMIWTRESLACSSARVGLVSGSCPSGRGPAGPSPPSGWIEDLRVPGCRSCPARKKKGRRSRDRRPISVRKLGSGRHASLTPSRFGYCLFTPNAPIILPAVPYSV